MYNSKINYWVSVLIMVTGMLFVTVSCSDNSTSANGDEEASEETIAIDLSNISAGEALIDVADDTSFTWQGTATWDDGGRFATGGNSYSAWIVTVAGENGEELRIRIVENEDSSTMAGPDDGTYEVGSGQTENSVTVDTGSDAFLSNNSSGGSFTVTQASDGNILEIELEATDLEKGGIGSQDEYVSIKSVIKATSE